MPPTSTCWRAALRLALRSIAMVEDPDAIRTILVAVAESREVTGRALPAPPALNMPGCGNRSLRRRRRGRNNRYLDATVAEVLSRSCRRRARFSVPRPVAQEKIA